jgi:hypothetical protein
MMAYPHDPSDRSPKGDHNRRLSLGLDPDRFAAEAGISTDELRRYELTDVDGPFDPRVAERVGDTLERLERQRSPIVDNGNVPALDTVEGRVYASLHSPELEEKLVLADSVSAEQLVATALAEIDPVISLVGFGERARGPLREILVEWRGAQTEVTHRETIVLSPPSEIGAGK